MKQRLSLLLSLTYCTLGQGIFLTSATAQVTPDGTTNTTVDVDGSDFTIQEGERAGGNLFHSFGEFSVPTDGSAFFNNAADIVNIFSRVTGGNISNIDGLLRANGGANLFLLNPAGIIFGENARLDVGGSFFGTSADSFVFEDGEFSATDLDNPPLLTINAPIGLNFRDNPGDIVNQSVAENVGLQVPQGENITLVGGEINLEGGRITAPSGRVELGGLSAAGEIGLTEDGSLSFPDSVTRADISLTNRALVTTSGEGGGEIQVWGKRVTLSQGSQIKANTLGSEAGRGLTVNATESVQLIGTAADGQPLGSAIKREIGDITSFIQLTQLLTAPSSGLFAETEGTGKAGDLTISTPALLVRDGAIVSAFNFGPGDGGNLTVNATESVELIGVSAINNGKSGLYTFALGSGKAGDMTVNTRQLRISDGALLSTATIGPGDAGNLTVNATESVKLIGTSTIDPLIRAIQLFGLFGRVAPENLAQALPFPSGLITGTFGPRAGAGGNVTINTGQLQIRDGAIVFTNSVGSSGDAGNLTVTATESVQLIGPSLARNSGDTRQGRFFYSGLVSATDGLASRRDLGPGAAGELRITTPTLQVLDGALIIGSSFSNGGGGGSITVEANTLEATNGGQLRTSSTSSSSDAGNITLKVSDGITLAGEGSGLLAGESSGVFANTSPDSTGDGGIIFIDTTTMTIRDGAQVAVNSEGTGIGGNIDLQADSLTLDRGTITAETASNQGGNIDLKVDERLSLRDNSLISAEAGITGDGGNIDIDTQFIIAFPSQPPGDGNDIVASAEFGMGGNININAESLFGIEERPAEPGNGTNDIDASSEFGLDGSVFISTPDTNIRQKDTAIPSNPIESEQAIGQACQRTRTADQPSGLTVKGKGGVPPVPTEPFMAELLIPDGKPITLDKKSDLNSLLEVEENETEPENPNYIPEDIKPIKTSRGDIYPARGIIKTEDGRVILTTYPTDNINTRTPHIAANCSLVKDEG
ncbi:MAG: S-layer family protein [Xenococcus sp. MO_188.B8]|nr:S-layer family protein [Xenococcus sp. MO_188.B8]